MPPTSKSLTCPVRPPFISSLPHVILHSHTSHLPPVLRLPFTFIPVPLSLSPFHCFPFSNSYQHLTLTLVSRRLWPVLRIPHRISAVREANLPQTPSSRQRRSKGRNRADSRLERQVSDPRRVRALQSDPRRRDRGPSTRRHRRREGGGRQGVE